MTTGLSLSELPLALSRPQSEWAKQLKAGLRLTGDLVIPLTAEARTGGLVRLRSTPDFPPTPLPGLAGILGSDEAALLAPPALGGVDSLLLVELVLDYDRSAEKIQGLNLVFGYPVKWDIGAEWLGRPGQLVVEGLRASVDMIDFLAGNTDELSVYGVLTLPGSAHLKVGLSLPSLELWAMLDDQTPLRLRDIVALFDFNGLPDGLHDLSLSMLTLRAAPLSKSGDVAVCLRDVWQIQLAERKFALSEVFFRLGYAAGRGFSGALGGTLRLAGVPLTLSAQYQPGGGWTFLGMLAGQTPGSAGNTLKLRALLSELLNQDTLPPEVPDIEFTDLSLSFTPAGQLTLACAARVDLSLGGSEIKIQNASLRVERAAGGTVSVALALECSANIADTLQIEKSTLRFQFDTGSRSWSLSGGFKATLFKQQPALDLQASLQQSPGGTQISFTAESAELGFDLSAGARMYLGFRSFTLDRKTTGTSLSAAVRARLTGLPKPLDRCLPQQLDLVGSFADKTLSLGLAATFGIDIPLPAIELQSSRLELGTMRLELRNIALQISANPSFGATVAIGLPSELNKLFGKRADGTASVNVFRTYQPDKPDSLIALSLKLSTAGLSAELLTPPLTCITGQGRSWSLDLGEFGAVNLTVPTISASGTSLSGSGAINVDPQRGLHLPLTPIRALFEMAGLSAAAKIMPRSVRLDRIRLLNESGEVDLAGMLGVRREALPAEVQSALATFDKITTRLPERLRSYLSFDIRSLSFNLSTDAAGNISLEVATSPDAPLRCLIPGFPYITGIQLRRLSFGPVFGGSLFKLDIDADIDMFDFATLVMTQAMPDAWFGDEKERPLPPRGAIQRTLHLNNLLAFIVYQAGVPIPLPLLYTKLGYSYVGIEGFRSELHLYCHSPKPTPTGKFSFDMGEALQLLQSLKRFFMERDYLLSAQTAPQSLNLVYRVDRASLTLPRYLGGAQLGTTAPVEVFNVYKTLAGTLDTVKTGSPRYIIKTVPVERRTGQLSMNLLGMATADVGWALVTRDEVAQNSEPVARLLAGSTGRAAVPASDVQAIIPSPAEVAGTTSLARSADPDEVLGVLRGGFTLGGLGLESLFVMRTSPSGGFATAMRLRSRLADLMSLELRGVLKVAPRGNQPLLLAGTSQLAFGGRTVMYGGFALSSQQFQIEGLFDFFPPEAGVALRGRLAGSIGNNGFRLAGKGELALFNIPLIGAELDMRLERSEYALYVSTTLLGATASFRLSANQTGLSASGSLSPIRIGSLLTVSRAPGDLTQGPSFSLVRTGSSTTCQISGYASLLDLVNVQANIDISPSGSSFSFSSRALGVDTNFNCVLPSGGGLTLAASFSLGLNAPPQTFTRTLSDGKTEQVTSPALSQAVTGSLSFVALPPPVPESLIGPWRKLEAQQRTLFAPTCLLRSTSAAPKLAALEDKLWLVHEWHLALTTGRVPVVRLDKYRAAAQDVVTAADDLAAAIASLAQARPSEGPSWHELASCLGGVRTAAQRGVDTASTAQKREDLMQPQLDGLVGTLVTAARQRNESLLLKSAQRLRDLVAARSLYPDDPSSGGAGCAMFVDERSAAYMAELDLVIAATRIIAPLLEKPYTAEPASLQQRLQSTRSAIPSSPSVGYRLPNLDALADAYGQALARLQAGFGSQEFAQALAARGNATAAAALADVSAKSEPLKAATADLIWVLANVDGKPAPDLVNGYVAQRSDYKRAEAMTALAQPGADERPLRELLARRPIDIGALSFIGFAVPVDAAPGRVAVPTAVQNSQELAVSLGLRLSFQHGNTTYDLAEVQIDGPAARKLSEVPALIAGEVAARIVGISNENVWLDRRINRHLRARQLRRQRAAEHDWALERYHGLPARA